MFSDARRARLSDAMLGNKHLLGHVHSEETRAKMRESAKARWALKKAADQKTSEGRRGLGDISPAEIFALRR